MKRRTLIKGAVATAAAPLSSFALPEAARASTSTETYHIAVCDQTPGFNSILIHPRAADWTPTNCVWSWAAPDTTGWHLLTDCKFRQSSAFGEIVLATASGGNVGIVQMSTGTLLTDSSVLNPGGNPHAIERIPNVDAIVVASAEAGPGHPAVTMPDGSTQQGYLTIYAPTSSDDPRSLTHVDSFSFNGAHGLWYDGTYLWALGQDRLVRYACVGTGTAFRLQNTGVAIKVESGHSLDTDLSVPDRLLLSQGSYTNWVSKSNPSAGLQPWTPSGVGVKSLSRVASGEQFIVLANGSIWTSPTVDIYDASGNFVEHKSLAGDYQHVGEFYKARVSWSAFSG